MTNKTIPFEKHMNFSFNQGKLVGALRAYFPDNRLSIQWTFQKNEIVRPIHSHVEHIFSSIFEYVPNMDTVYSICDEERHEEHADRYFVTEHLNGWIRLLPTREGHCMYIKLYEK